MMISFCIPVYNAKEYLKPCIESIYTQKITHFEIICIDDCSTDGSYELLLNLSAVYPEMVVKLRSDEYYINMMIAWYFATALAKQYDTVIPFIEEKRLDKWTHNKAIQKSVESYRITPQQKEYLKTFKY